MTRLHTLFAAAAVSLAAGFSAPSAQATVVYSEGFDNGFNGWSRGSAWWADCSGQGNCVQPSGGQQGGYYHLGTAYGAEPDHRFFISPTIGVIAGATYSLQFYVADNYNLSSCCGSAYGAPVQAKINGTALGAPQVAANWGWNLFNLTWTAGTSTTAEISLWNEYQLSGYWLSNPNGSWGYGNDFAIDTVSLTCTADCVAAAPQAVPEPGSLLLTAGALLALAGARRRRAR